MKKVTRAMQCEQDASAGVDASELAQKMALLNGKVCSFALVHISGFNTPWMLGVCVVEATTNCYTR